MFNSMASEVFREMYKVCIWQSDSDARIIQIFDDVNDVLKLVEVLCKGCKTMNYTIERVDDGF